jgi:hypothetical protein
LATIYLVNKQQNEKATWKRQSETLLATRVLH